MKKKLVEMFAVIVTASYMLGCGNVNVNVQVDADNKSADVTVETEGTDSTVEEVAEESEDADNDKASAVGMANPWVETDENGIREVIGTMITLPKESQNVVYRLNEGISLAEIIFEYDGLEYDARIQCRNEFEDISGMYYEWADDLDGDIKGCKLEQKRAFEDGMTYDLCMWYNDETGIMYSLSTSAKDLDGFDILAIAEMIYDPEDEEADKKSQDISDELDAQISESLESFITWTGLQYFYEENAEVKALSAQQAIPMAAFAAQSLYVDEYTVSEDGMGLIIDKSLLEASMKGIFGKTFDLDDYDDTLATSGVVTKNKDGSVNVPLGDWGLVWPDFELVEVSQPDNKGNQKVYVRYYAYSYEDEDEVDDINYYAVYTIKQDKDSLFGIDIEDYIGSKDMAQIKDFPEK